MIAVVKIRPADVSRPAGRRTRRLSALGFKRTYRRTPRSSVLAHCLRTASIVRADYGAAISVLVAAAINVVRRDASTLGRRG
jgi:hypothetical protein